MRFQLDLTKEYGIVLEGGGARGSYQIGAWKALREVGIKIRGIAGASVGALNGALICMDDLEKAEEIWENIRYSQVIDVDDDVIETVKKLDLKSLDLVKVAEDAKKILKDKGLDITPLKNLIESVVDEDKIRSSDRELYLTTYSVTDRELLVLNAKDIPDGEIGDMLLASAYFPAFRNDKLGGKRKIFSYRLLFFFALIPVRRKSHLTTLGDGFSYHHHSSEAASSSSGRILTFCSYSSSTAIESGFLLYAFAIIGSSPAMICLARFAVAITIE